ncbi:MAG TPA: hypothetical protein ENN03_06705 [bacterium]|nr:hypothetical protein [bacterium]
MKRKNHIESEIVKTLKCFDEPGLKPSPFFAARVTAGIQEKTRPEAPVLSFRRWQPAVLVLAVVVNLVTATLYWTHRQRESAYRRQSLTRLFSEYGIQESVDPLDDIIISS